jgi:lipoprotein-anchoring transpeptidase ErfK/SrfK
MMRALALTPFLPALLVCSLAAPSRESEVNFDAAAINTPLTDPVALGAKGSAVVRAQILLDRAHFSCGQIDGDYGTNLEKTVTAFQRSRNLPANGSLSPETWAALNADTAPALITYNIDPQDVAGPFVKVPPKMMDQATLPSLGYASPLDELGEKFHASPGLLQALNRGKDFSKAGEQILVPNAATMPPGAAASVVVSKSDSSVTAYDAQGKILAYYVATVGSEHDPLPIGDWKIKGVAHNPVFHYSPELFWDAHPHDEKAVIPAGPRNPVGVVWIDLSKDHYGIHGTPDPAKIGHAESHGCIRLTNWDAAQLADMVRPGTPALLKE